MYAKSASNRLTDRRVTARAIEFARYEHQVLLRRATDAGMTVERDNKFTGAFQVRNPQQPGIVQITTHAGCSCSEFRTWARCPHNALVIDTQRGTPILETMRKAS